MDEEQAERRRKEGWDIVNDANRGYRRVVASPQPLRIVELPAIRALIAAGVVVSPPVGAGSRWLQMQTAISTVSPRS